MTDDKRFDTDIENYIEQRTPDLVMSKDQLRRYNEIVEACRGAGLDGFDYIYEFFRWDEISELAAYGGFPVRYPHYLFGMEFEYINQSYKYGLSKIYEMVVNNNPCYAYLLSSNSEVDNLTVIAHAYAHNDFFKNNFWFSNTNRNMVNEMANHGVRIKKYMEKYGRREVMRFLSMALSIQHLIDPDDVFEKREFASYQFDDPIISEEPRRLSVEPGHEYMDDFLNPENYIWAERSRIKAEHAERQRAFPEKPTRDIIGFVAENSSRLQKWMRDVLFIIREESLYFVPQIQTKVFNEGWASFWDEKIMAEHRHVGVDGIVEYAKHHAGVLGGKYSTNPYKLGYMLLNYVKERWDKGRFGSEWEDCKDRKARQEWDRKTGLGMQKLFELRKTHNDGMLIDEFLDQDFVDEFKFFLWERNEAGEYVIKSKDARVIKAAMLDEVGMGGFPCIVLESANFLGQGHLHLRHLGTRRTLNFKMTGETLNILQKLWGRPVVLSTFDVHENFDPTIPPEYNDMIAKIVLYSVNGKETHVGTMSEYRALFS